MLEHLEPKPQVGLDDACPPKTKTEYQDCEPKSQGARIVLKDTKSQSGLKSTSTGKRVKSLSFTAANYCQYANYDDDENLNAP